MYRQGELHRAGIAALLGKNVKAQVPQPLPITFVPAEDNPAYADQLAEFNRLVGTGTDPREVWAQTGIYSGAATGDVPVAEISDHEADFVGGAPPVTGLNQHEYNPLGDLFDHPELFAMYPQLADVNLRIKLPIVNVGATIDRPHSLGQKKSS